MVDLIVVALLQAVAGDPAQPAETAALTPQAEAVAETAEEDIGLRCRRQTVVGTRLAQRVCTTAAQRREMEEYARTEIQRGQSQMWTPPPTTGMPGPMGTD